MLEINEEIIAKAKQVKSVEELIALAKEHDFELTQEEAGEYFEALNQRTGELSDEELDNVAGGGSRTTDDTLLGLEPNYKCNLWEGKHEYINGGIGCIDCKHSYEYSNYFYSCNHPDAINFS